MRRAYWLALLPLVGLCFLHTGCSSDSNGLKIIDLQEGNGDTVKRGDTVEVNYTGWLITGKQFDSSLDRGRPAQFKLGSGQVIPGWDQGVPGMKVGGKRKLIIPPELAYGSNGRPPAVPPNMALIFEIEVLRIVPPAGSRPQNPGGARVKIDDVKVGTGREAKTGDTVTVHYTGRLVTGGKFDSSVDRGEPFTFKLGRGQVIQGWEQGVPGMKVGGKRKLTIPPELAYGEQGRPPTIPPDATLLFEIELLKVQ
jgi:peptidylprolyl isomerase